MTRLLKLQFLFPRVPRLRAHLRVPRHSRVEFKRLSFRSGPPQVSPQQKPSPLLPTRAIPPQQKVEVMMVALLEMPRRRVYVAQSQVASLVMPLHRSGLGQIAPHHPRHRKQRPRLLTLPMQLRQWMESCLAWIHWMAVARPNGHFPWARLRLGHKGQRTDECSDFSGLGDCG